MTAQKSSSVTVIIVNFNGGDYLKTAVEHLKRQTRTPDEVIIVDNASTDGSIDQLNLTGLPDASIIALDENTGFARANNLAAAEAKGTWLALLNPDTEAQTDWLEKLLGAAQRHPDTKVFASAQLDATHPTVMDGAGDSYFFLGIPWRGGFGRPVTEMPSEGDCFSPCGASALIRRDAFLEVGGFDESYFCYCEDVDLGFRLRLKGERCIFVPDAVVLHHGSAISGRYSDFTIRLGTRNRLRTYLTSMPPLGLALTLPGHILATLYLYARSLGTNRAAAMRRGLTEAFFMMPSILRRRSDVQRTRTASSLDLWRAMCWNPAILHKRKTHVWPVASAAKKRGREKSPPAAVTE